MHHSGPDHLKPAPLISLYRYVAFFGREWLNYSLDFYGRRIRIIFIASPPFTTSSPNYWRKASRQFSWWAFTFNIYIIAPGVVIRFTVLTGWHLRYKARGVLASLTVSEWARLLFWGRLISTDGGFDAQATIAWAGGIFDHNHAF